jgi:hypothetical protein
MRGRILTNKESENLLTALQYPTRQNDPVAFCLWRETSGGRYILMGVYGSDRD